MRSNARFARAGILAQPKSCVRRNSFPADKDKIGVPIRLQPDGVRMIMYLTGVSNIRDVLPYPRTVGNAEF